MNTLLLIWTAVAGGFTAVALFRLRRIPAVPPVSLWPKVLLLRPVDAPTPRELSNLAMPVEYGGALEHVVLSPYPPRLAADVAWVFSDPVTANRKAGHLSFARATLKHDGCVVVAADGDVVVTRELLESLVGTVVTGAALAVAPPSPGDAHSAGGDAVRGLLAHGHHSFLALSVMQVGAAAVCGKAIAFSPSAFALVDGCVRHIGEDLELARLLHVQKLRVQVTPSFAQTSIEEGLRWRDAAARFTRWMVVLKAHRPALFVWVPVLFAPTPLLLLLNVFTGPSPALAAFIVLRVALSVRLGGLGGSARGALWDWLQGEALLLQAWASGLFATRVSWRGRTLRVKPGGGVDLP